MSAEMVNRRHPVMYPEVSDPRSTIERIMVLVMVRAMFDDDAGVCEQIVKLTNLCSNPQDEDVAKVRAFATSACATSTLPGMSPDEAIRVVRSICQQRLRPTN